MTRRVLVLLALASVAAVSTAAPAAGQYFGRNKVQYRAFEFQIIRTGHFDVYFYPQEREAALDAARMVERSYARLSRLLQHEFSDRKPLIVYASHADFQQTNALPFTLDESTGGVTEALKGRMILPFTGSYADFDHVLTHELVHGFQYDVIFRGGVLSDGTAYGARLPLWFMEGMAEYLSIGRIDAHTVSWLRDAVLNGYLRSIAEMNQRDDYLSYRFGQSLWSFIGAKWGDEVVGVLLQKAPRLGIERAFTTTLGLTLEELSREWQTQVRATYLPQLTEYEQPEQRARQLTKRERLFDPWYLAPALSPDGAYFAYLSQHDGFAFDLWLGDAHTGRPVRRLVRSARDAGLESLRYMSSAAAFSPDGRHLAFAAKDGGQDALYIYDVARRRIARRLRFDLNGIAAPTWSPDGQRIAFTGLDGGVSDLFVTDLDGHLSRLTNDRHADLMPAWSPDGERIAFTTDRDGSDLDRLVYGNMRVAVLDLGTRRIDVLPHQESGKNINPAWSPDGGALIWVSDRTGTNNLYLFERETRTLSRITDLLSGVIAVTPLSPVISWSRSGPLLFTYFRNAGYETYRVEDPLALPRTPVAGTVVAAAEPQPGNEREQQPADDRARPQPGNEHPATSQQQPAPVNQPQPDTAAAQPDTAAAPPHPTPRATSWYRTPDGTVRPSADAPRAPQGAPAPMSVIALLDSAALALPDTATFAIDPYRVKFSADMIGQPSVGAGVGGYYGNGVYGGSYISLSDMLGNHNVLVAASINGAISDASVFTGYSFLRRRTNLNAAFWQVPLYRYLGGGYFPMRVGGEEREIAANVFLRDVIRGGQLGLAYPFSTFRRVELNLTGVNYHSDILYRGYDTETMEPVEIDRRTSGFSYAQPQLALVFDNSLFGWTGPIVGRRYRLQLSRTVGDLAFNEALLDFRNYANFRQRVVLATRLVALTRFGDDSGRFGLFWGGPYYVRGYDYGSFDPRGRECTESREHGGRLSISRCPVRDQLVGASAAFVNTELRFPIIRELQVGMLGSFPPVDAVAFLDGGMAWDERVCIVQDFTRRDSCAAGQSLPVTVRWRRRADDDPFLVRTPLVSYGLGLRINIFYAVLRLDYAIPHSRPDRGGVFSFSLGPGF